MAERAARSNATTTSTFNRTRTDLLPSLVFATVFGPWGLGLFQRLPYWGAVLVAATTALALSFVARWVIGRFGQGPFEAAMRAWTWR